MKIRIFRARDLPSSVSGWQGLASKQQNN